MSNATDLAKMARDNGIETRKLANNSFNQNVCLSPFINTN